MNQIERITSDSALNVACFCHFAGNNLEAWKLLEGTRVTHWDRGSGHVVSILEALSGVSIRIKFDKSVRDFPESFRLPDITPCPYQWKFDVPEDLVFSDEIIYSAIEQLEEAAERIRQLNIAKERLEQEEQQFVEEARLREEKNQREQDEAILALRESVKEVFYITPIANLKSILTHGILSNEAAQKLPVPPRSVAMEEVQDLRRKKQVLGRKLHSYVNFYLNPRNPMMYRLRERHDELCVLGVDGSVLDLSRVVVSDGNAASSETKFWFAPYGLGRVNWDIVDSDWWVDFGNPQIDRASHRKRIIMSEVLVPHAVESTYIRNVYTSGSAGQTVVQLFLRQARTDAHTLELPRLFFRSVR